MILYETNLDISRVGLWNRRQGKRTKSGTQHTHTHTPTHTSATFRSHLHSHVCLMKFTYITMVEYSSGLSFVTSDVGERCGRSGGSNTSCVQCDSEWTWGGMLSDIIFGENRCEVQIVWRSERYYLANTRVFAY